MKRKTIWVSNNKIAGFVDLLNGEVIINIEEINRDDDGDIEFEVEYELPTNATSTTSSDSGSQIAKGEWKDGLNCETCKHRAKSHDSVPCFTCGRRKYDYYEGED